MIFDNFNMATDTLLALFTVVNRAIDGSKFRASNSRLAYLSEKKLDKS